tara:strand:- start:673 stop:852 length:180 start_codon:yes stop_codon:yes gene_type:complete
MKLLIELDMDNDAFVADPNKEASRILREYAYELNWHLVQNVSLKDLNGTTVGKAVIELN